METSDHINKRGVFRKAIRVGKNQSKIEMRILTLKQISNMDSPALTAVIDYWKDYDPKSVLLANAELKKRNFAIPEGLLKRQNEFCAKNNYNNIDTYLNTYLKENGYNSYEEYFVKEVYQYAEDTELKIISSTNKGFTWIIGIVAIIAVVMFLKAGEIGLGKNKKIKNSSSPTQTETGCKGNGSRDCISEIRQRFKKTGKNIIAEQYEGDGTFQIQFIDYGRGLYNAYIRTNCDCEITNINVTSLE